jgi:hypothetical protein
MDLESQEMNLVFTRNESRITRNEPSIHKKWIWNSQEMNQPHLQEMNLGDHFENIEKGPPQC